MTSPGLKSASTLAESAESAAMITPKWGGFGCELGREMDRGAGEDDRAAGGTETVSEIAKAATDAVVFAIAREIFKKEDGVALDVGNVRESLLWLGGVVERGAAEGFEAGGDAPGIERDEEFERESFEEALEAIFLGSFDGDDGAAGGIGIRGAGFRRRRAGICCQARARGLSGERAAVFDRVPHSAAPCEKTMKKGVKTVEQEKRSRDAGIWSERSCAAGRVYQHGGKRRHTGGLRRVMTRHESLMSLMRIGRSVVFGRSLAKKCEAGDSGEG
jgi:hypothetical protein